MRHAVYHMAIHPETGEDLDIQVATRTNALTVVEDITSPFGRCTIVEGDYFDICRFVTWLYGEVPDLDDVLWALPGELEESFA